MGELLIRMVFSLAVVVGLVIVLARVGSRRFRGRVGSPVEVLHRQALSKTASVSVVSVAGRTLVLGTTEHQVSVLTELDDDALAALGLTRDDATPEHTAEEAAEVPSGEEILALASPQPVQPMQPAQDEAPRPALTLVDLFGEDAVEDLAPAAPATAAAPVATAYAAPDPATDQVAPVADAALLLRELEDPVVEDSGYADFAAELRRQLAQRTPETDVVTEPAEPVEPVAVEPKRRKAGRHAAPAPQLELPPAVSGGARAARATTPEPAAAADPHAELAALQAALAAARAQVAAHEQAALQRAASLDPAPAATPTTGRRGRKVKQAPPQAGGPLAGSVLSPQTWRQALHAVTGRAS